jgi:hypothetical protein
MEEQETTINVARTGDTVQIYTNNIVHLRKLRADDRVAEVKGGEDWGSFSVPASLYDPLSGFKRQRRRMTEEEREAATKRLADARAKRGKAA